MYYIGLVDNDKAYTARGGLNQTHMDTYKMSLSNILQFLTSRNFNALASRILTTAAFWYNHSTNIKQKRIMAYINQVDFLNYGGCFN